jgi:hypothetical protein
LQPAHVPSEATDALWNNTPPRARSRPGCRLYFLAQLDDWADVKVIAQAPDGRGRVCAGTVRGHPIAGQRDVLPEK